MYNCYFIICASISYILYLEISLKFHFLAGKVPGPMYILMDQVPDISTNSTPASANCAFNSTNGAAIIVCVIALSTLNIC